MDIMTVGQIANEIGFSRVEVQYAVDRLRIKPIGRANMTRLFDPNVTDQVRVFLKNRRSYAGNRSPAVSSVFDFERVLSISDLEGECPGLSQLISQRSKVEGPAAARTRLSQLAKLAGDDVDFIVEQFQSGADIEAAKTAFIARLRLLNEYKSAGKLRTDLLKLDKGSEKEAFAAFVALRRAEKREEHKK